MSFEDRISSQCNVNVTRCFQSGLTGSFRGYLARSSLLGPLKRESLLVTRGAACMCREFSPRNSRNRKYIKQSSLLLGIPILNSEYCMSLLSSKARGRRPGDRIVRGSDLGRRVLPDLLFYTPLVLIAVLLEQVIGFRLSRGLGIGVV